MLAIGIKYLWVSWTWSLLNIQIHISDQIQTIYLQRHQRCLKILLSQFPKKCKLFIRFFLVYIACFFAVILAQMELQTISMLPESSFWSPTSSSSCLKHINGVLKGYVVALPWFLWHFLMQDGKISCGESCILGILKFCSGLMGIADFVVLIWVRFCNYFPAILIFFSGIGCCLWSLGRLDWWLGCICSRCWK